MKVTYILTTSADVIIRVKPDDDFDTPVPITDNSPSQEYYPVSLTFKTLTVLHHKCVTTYDQIAQAQYKLF